MQLAKYSVLRVCKFLFIGLHWNHWLVFIFMQVLVYLWFCWNVFVILLECFFNIFLSLSICVWVSVKMFQYLCLCICDLVWVFVFVYLWSCVSIFVCLSVILCEYLCLCVCDCVWVFVFVYLWLCLSICVCDWYYGESVEGGGEPGAKPWVRRRLQSALMVTSDQCCPQPASHITP